MAVCHPDEDSPVPGHLDLERSSLHRRLSSCKRALVARPFCRSVTAQQLKSRFHGELPFVSAG
jgi:hypothetical protein